MNPKIAGAITFVVAALILGGDWLLLGGEKVFYRGVHFSDDPVAIELDRVGEKHTFKVYTREKIPVVWSVKDPSGNEIHSSSEVVSHKGTRRFSLMLEEAGSYAVTVQRRMMTGQFFGTVSLRVKVNDRRIIGPLVDKLQFWK